jgi:hypothetical protein
MIAENRIQAVARFIIGFGTEQDAVWRDYNLDFCGTIDYASGGEPITFHPVGNSGYSLGSLQWDFGQGQDLAGPFVESFEAWIPKNPKATPLSSDPEFVTRGLALDGNTLRARPTFGLHKQDVQALSEYVRSDDGSNWVNQYIDDNLIGSDQKLHVVVLNKTLGLSLVGVARQLEMTKAFKSYQAQNRTDATDLILAIGMKAYNQSPGTFTKKFLPFLAGTPSVNEISTWYLQFSKTGGLYSGVKDATDLSLFWSKWCAANAGWLQAQMSDEMAANCCANPCLLSKSDGAFVLAKQIFEDSSRFEKFAKAIVTGTDFVDKGLFDKKTGVILKNPKTNRRMPGVLAKNGASYFWDAADNAYKLNGNSWAAVPIAQIKI